MPRFRLPNSATIHTARAFLELGCPFRDDGGDAVLELHPQWAYLEPVALSMVAAWGAYWRRMGRSVRVETLGAHVGDAAGMRLFQHLGLEMGPSSAKDRRAGSLPLMQVRTRGDVSAIFERLPAMLALDDDPESLAAVQYSLSELIRNVLEHSGSPDGAFVCARRYTSRPPHRVTIAVADCGRGIGGHLGRVHPEAAEDDLVARGAGDAAGDHRRRGGVVRHAGQCRGGLVHHAQHREGDRRVLLPGVRGWCIPVAAHRGRRAAVTVAGSVRREEIRPVETGVRMARNGREHRDPHGPHRGLRRVLRVDFSARPHAREPRRRIRFT